TKTLNQNTTVGGTSGTLALQANPFDLNGYTCKITNPLASAITRTSGYIISETLPTSTEGYGLVDWEIGSTVDNYTIPFGTVAGTYIPFIYNVTSAGTTGGNISVGTYPTDVTQSPNNRPLPSGVTNLNDSDGAEAATDVLDRFWIVDLNNFSANPVADLTFTYREDEWDAIVGSTNLIDEDSLEAWRWNGSLWQNPTIGNVNITANTVTAPNIDYSGPWTLRMLDSTITIIPDCNNLSLPNAFSPNNDGRNDLFSIHGWPGCVSDFSLVIFNRWGQKVYETENVSAYWDGTLKGKALDPGVYIYYINAKSVNGEDIVRKGNISLIK
ncbi:MAG: gliding motility-associated C-terminal domain-containing protein, partial [Bacteroidia bacterium]